MAYGQSMFMAGYKQIAANSEGNIVYQEDEGKIFVAKKLFASATSTSFYLKDWKDGHNRSWVRGKTSTDVVAGVHLVTAAGLPLILPLPIVIYGTDQHTVVLVDTSGVANNIYITLIGEEYTTAQFKVAYPAIAKDLGL